MILALALALACAPESVPDLPKVIVVVSDATRADLGGAPLPEWWKEGREYTHAYSASNVTPTSTVTLTTGRYPREPERQMGVRLPTDAWPTSITSDQPVVTMLAKRPLPRGGVPGSIELVQQATADLLAGKLGAAAYIHTHGAHEPYDGVLAQPAAAPWYKWNTSTVNQRMFEDRRHGDLDPDLAAWTRLQYRSAAEHALAGIAPLIGVARASGATVIFTADHGDALGEDGRWGHATDLHDPQIHVPLIVWGPGVEPGTDSTPVPATCVGQTARLVLGQLVPDACDLRTGDIRGDVVAGMLLADGTWDERVILPTGGL